MDLKPYCDKLPNSLWHSILHGLILTKDTAQCSSEIRRISGKKPRSDSVFIFCFCKLLLGAFLFGFVVTCCPKPHMLLLSLSILALILKAVQGPAPKPPYQLNSIYKFSTPSYVSSMQGSHLVNLPMSPLNSISCVKTYFSHVGLNLPCRGC